MHRVAVHHAKGNGGSRTHTAAPLLKAASFRSSTQTCQMNRTRAPARIGRTPPPPSHSPTPFSRHSTTQRSRRALEDDPGVPSATHAHHVPASLTTFSSPLSPLPKCRLRSCPYSKSRHSSLLWPSARPRRMAKLSPPSLHARLRATRQIPTPCPAAMPTMASSTQAGGPGLVRVIFRGRTSSSRNRPLSLVSTLTPATRRTHTHPRSTGPTSRSPSRSGIGTSSRRTCSWSGGGRLLFKLPEEGSPTSSTIRERPLPTQLYLRLRSTPSQASLM